MPHRALDRRRLLAGLLALPAVPLFRQDAPAGAWRPLFNGRDLDGWETFLGKPPATLDLPGLPRDGAGVYQAPLGVDIDPRRVFSVVASDGQPAIRISGEIYGALTTRETFADYHLRLDFRWGERRWPPREDKPRDSGCCYHAVPPHGASYGFWMRSCEFQIQEGDCGDFYSLAGVIVDSRGAPVAPGDPASELAFARGAPPVTGHTKRLIRTANHERPRGEWNTLELLCLGQRSRHIVNGRTVMELTGIRQRTPAGESPLTRGCIQLQSEAAEVFYRNIAIRPLRDWPEAGD